MSGMNALRAVPHVLRVSCTFPARLLSTCPGALAPPRPQRRVPRPPPTRCPTLCRTKNTSTPSDKRPRRNHRPHSSTGTGPHSSAPRAFHTARTTRLLHDDSDPSLAPPPPPSPAHAHPRNGHRATTHGRPPPRGGLRPKQSLGQNFLRDASVAEHIVSTFRAEVARVCPSAGVVEVGPGTGALTGRLLDHFPRMHALDIDQRAVAYLRAMYPSLDVARANVLSVDWSACAATHGSSGAVPRLAVVGNLPYNIVSQILFCLLEAPAPSVALAVVMMQREVAERVTARPRSKAYGILSVVSQLYARPAVLFGVPAAAFSPRPKVESAMVRFEFASHERLDVYNTTLTAGLRKVVRAAFQQRRKTLRNALRALCEEEGVELSDRWADRRAEELSPDEFIDLTQFVFAVRLRDNPHKVNPSLSRPDTVWRPSSANSGAVPLV